VFVEFNDSERFFIDFDQMVVIVLI
jgi:hypothetical protein